MKLWRFKNLQSTDSKETPVSFLCCLLIVSIYSMPCVSQELKDSNALNASKIPSSSDSPNSSKTLDVQNNLANETSILDSETPVPLLNHVKVPDRTRRTTNFEWSPVVKAKSYEIEITPIGRAEGQNTPYNFTVTNPSWDGELKPGKYSMRLRSRDKRNVPGDWSNPEVFQVKLYAPKLYSPLAQDEIQSSSAESHSLTLHWEAQSEASLYKIHIEDENKNFIKDLETSKNELTLSVPVARKYQWSIIGHDLQGNEGEPLSDVIPFTIVGKQLNTPQIITPETSFVRQLKWQPSMYAQKYSYILYRRDKLKSRKWIKFQDGETQNNLFIFNPKWKGGEYKLSVTAHAPLRINSKTYSISFDVATGYRSIAAEKRATLRKSIVRTNDWYFIASYFITQIQYQSRNGDKEVDSSFSAIGGTGRLGVGYFSSDNPYGFLGIIDYSGFTIDSQTYKYPSAEAHGTYRVSSDSLGEIRVSSGFYLKELPEIIGQSTSDFKVKTIDTFGMHGGGEYWYPLTSKLGLQINGRVYYPISGKTPSGAKINPSPSLQFGFLGSLRLNEKATGLMGYAYRKDQTNYKVTDNTSLADGFTTNTSSVVGHYLNFLLEWDI